MKIKFPDYDNCITNIPNSILNYFGFEGDRKTSTTLDSHLDKEYDNVIVLLLDGMGKCIMDENLDKNGFFQKHLKETYSSVFPPTTVAATTSMLSGLNPCEHGWLGWDCYFPQINKNVTVFLNKEMETNQPAADYNVAYRYCGYENIVKKIERKCGKDTAYFVAPFVEPYPQIFEDVCKRITDLCVKPGKKFIYSYWPEPDFTMHKKGCYGEEGKSVLKNLETQVKKMCSSLKKTLIIVTADHGHIDSKCVSIKDYPKILECLVRVPSIEPRALNLFIKQEKKAQFISEFQKEFGEKFWLMSKEEVIQRQLFGPNTEHPSFRDMLGDYVAIAISDLTICVTREEANDLIGVHAGITEDEMEIPLIIIDR